MSKKKNSNNTATGSNKLEQMSGHDAAAMIISTAITMQNEAGLEIKMRNIPGRGFAIVIPGWYYDGRNISRRPPEMARPERRVEGSSEPAEELVEG